MSIRMNALAKLFQKLISSMQISIEEVTSHTNIKKDLQNSALSWRMFMKGLSLLGFRKVEIVIKLHHSNGTTEEHNETVIISEELLEQK